MEDDDRKHGRDKSAVERTPRPPCQIGSDACDQLSFPKVTLFFLCLFLLRCQTPQIPGLEACTFSSSGLYEDEKAIWWINMYKF